MSQRRLKIVLFLLLGIYSVSPAQVKRFIRKAELNVERGNLEAATRYYEKALAAQPENIRANYGYGMMLCELLDNYDKALPYLEMANQPPVEDSLYDLMFALGKCYQNNGDFEKAISYFDRLQFVVDLEAEKDFHREITKRRNDCQYAIAHRADLPRKDIHVVNGGRTINTDKPEYVPVLLPGDKMIFTSKRKDDEKEKINFLDGKYFESMYITDVTPHGFRNTRRYTIPDQYGGKSKSNRHESVISLSQDGTKLFTFKNGFIYEVKLNETDRSQPKPLQTAVNKNIYENHAFLTRDEKELYFSVEAESSLGGTDIYHSVRDEAGNWSVPANLGEPINTVFDEDAPFVSADGQTLFFASTGHPGYGNFDMYRAARTADGKWSAPENLGKPLNSPGHDLFLVRDSANTTGYFASSRHGGFGDMDIYKILYLDKLDTTCTESFSTAVAMSVVDADSTDYKNIVTLSVPPGYQVLSSEWRLNGQLAEGDTLRFDRDYRLAGTYTVGNKLVALCDTCLSPVVACNYTVNTIPEIKTKPAGDDTLAKSIDLSGHEGELDEDQARRIGFDPRPVLFAFDKYTLGPKAMALLDSNIVVLKKYDMIKIRLVGYTDARGPASYNQLLSERRAKAVMSYLVKHGVQRSQITMVEGKGERDLLNDCDDSKPCPESDHKRNRRVKVILVSDKLAR